MRPTNRLIRNRLLPNRLTQETRQKRVDIWFLRAAQTATVLGVAVAVFGYFYTVRPIYQKALLDEAIAKKELEIKEANNALTVSYARLKGHAIANLVQNSSMCQTYTMTIMFGKDHIMSRSKERDLEKYLSRSVSACLTQAVAKTPDLATLQAGDHDALMREIDRIGLKLDSERLVAIEEAKNLRARALKDRLFLMKEFEASIKNNPSQADSGKSGMPAKFEDQIGQIQEGYMLRFASRIGAEIDSLDHFSWPGTGPIDEGFRRRINAFSLPMKSEK